MLKSNKKLLKIRKGTFKTTVFYITICRQNNPAERHIICVSKEETSESHQTFVMLDNSKLHGEYNS